MKRLTLMSLVLVMVVGMFASPASAGDAPADIGTIEGTADVGKVRTTVCNNHGGGAVSGSGLGFPVLTNSPKNGFWKLSTPAGGVQSQTAGAGALDACGELRNVRVFGVGSFGAACGISRGHSGSGKITFGGSPTVWLKDLGWTTSLGGTLPVQGEAFVDNNGSTNGKKPGPGGALTAIIQAQGGANCITKRDAPIPLIGTGPKPAPPAAPHGATTFVVRGVYIIT